MADDGEHGPTAEEELILKHKKEKKDLQAEIAKLKHSVPKGDKKRKREITAQIALQEAQLEEKHEKELAALRSSNEITDGFASVALNDRKVAGANDSENATKSKKMSKAQRRREKKAEEERAREQLIAQQEIENLTGVRNVEAVKLKKILTDKGVKIYEVPSDGNCLYAAIECQLKNRDIKVSVQELRDRTAEYMRQNIDDFLPFLSKPETGDPYTLDEFNAYCKELQTTPAWGGQLEINALSKFLEVPIEVIQADVPSIISGEEFKTPHIMLTYHRHMFGLGEHYNAVVPRTAEDEEDEFS